MLITFTDKGLYCAAGDFYIDPWRPVNKAVITHAHSDHARWGCKYYLSHIYTVPLLRARLGEQYYEGINWEQAVYMNGVKVSLHPAGHIIGSSQVRVEYKGEIWVISGDYKTEDDGISGQFQPVSCHNFVTESTFGLPIYNWQPQEIIYEQIRQWVLHNQQQFDTSILIGYSLGKAQRILQAVAPLGIPVLAHGAIYNMQEAITATGITLPPIERITPETPKARLKGSIVLAPPSADGSSWMRKMAPYSTGMCSGWMQVRGNVRRRNADAGFILSDHADWKGLLYAIEATGAEKVYVTHGFQSALSRYLNEKGIWSAEVKTEYGGEEDTSTTENE
jgi:putative mRNA 3-end processing factor